jgi:uncharacterized protein YndB with AHSA1/START domain
VIRFGFPIDVARPVSEVFGYVTDPRNLPEWQGTETVEQLTAGPVGVGTRFREVRQLLGRRLESISEVSAFEPNLRFDLRIVSGPAPVEDRWTFEAVDGGTRMQFSTEGRAPRPLRPLEPVLAIVLRRRREGHHRRLKRALEGRGTSALR